LAASADRKKFLARPQKDLHRRRIVRNARGFGRCGTRINSTNQPEKRLAREKSSLLHTWIASVLPFAPPRDHP